MCASHRTYLSVADCMTAAAAAIHAKIRASCGHVRLGKNVIIELFFKVIDYLFKMKRMKEDMPMRDHK